MFPYWVKKLFPKKSRPAQRSRRPNRVRLELEHLEAREVPTVSAVLSGGQLVVSTDNSDDVLLEHSGSSTLVVNRFNLANQFAFGDGRITQGIHVLGGFDNVAIVATVKPVTTDLENIVFVGGDETTPGTLESIQAPLTLSSAVQVTLDDSRDGTGRNVTLNVVNNVVQVNNMSPFPIRINEFGDVFGDADLEDLSLHGGSGQNTFNVQDTPAAIRFFANVTTTNIFTGSAGDTVNVLGTSSAHLNIAGQAHDVVSVGNNGHLDRIAGEVNVNNIGGNFSDLIVSGFNAPSAQNVTMSIDNNAVGIIHGMAPADIKYQELAMRSVAVAGGSHGNTFTVADTFNNFTFQTTEIETGTGNNLVHVLATRGRLTINGEGGLDTVKIGDDTASSAGTMTGILGQIDVFNFGGKTSLLLNARADNFNHSVNLFAKGTFGEIDGAGLDVGAPITYDPTEMSDVDIFGGNGDDKFSVFSSSGAPIFLHGGSGSDRFTIGSGPGSLDTIQGLVNVIGGVAGHNTLIVNDLAGPPDTNRTVTIFPLGFTRTFPGLPMASVNVNFVQNETFNVSGSTIVQGTEAGTSTTIDVFGHELPVTLGPISGNTGEGTLQPIQGPINIESASSSPFDFPLVAINDLADTSARTVSITSTQVSGLTAPGAPINFPTASTLTLSIEGPIIGGSTFNIDGTPAVQGMQVVAPGSGDTVNVHTVPAAGAPGIPFTTFVVGQTVNVGQNHSLQAIQGTVEVNNDVFKHFFPLQGIPLANVNVDDSADAAAHTAVLDTVARADTSLLGRLSGTAGPITWGYAGTTAVNINFGAGTTNVNVLGTGVTTNLSNIVQTTVNVGNNNSIAGITGALNLENEPSFDSVNINDQADTAGHTAVIDTVTRFNETSLGRLSGIAAPITWDYFDTTVVDLNFGIGTSTVNVLGTGVSTNLFNNGAATVNIGNANSMAGITRALTLNNVGPLDQVNLLDGADNTDHPAVAIANSGVTGLFAPIIFGTPITVSKLAITAGNGHNAFTVTGSQALAGTTLNTGTNGINGGISTDTVNVQAIANPLIVNAGPGTDTINVGSTANTLDAIQALVTVNSGLGGLATLNINDQGSTTPHTYSLIFVPTGTFTRSAPGPVTVNFSGIPIQNLHVNKGKEAGTPTQAKDLALTEVTRVGQLATLSGRLVDQNPNAPLTLTVDWGDGSPVQVLEPGQRPFHLQHEYHRAGTYTVGVLWGDRATGEFNSRDLTITVRPARHDGDGDHDDHGSRTDDLDAFFAAFARAEEDRRHR